MAIESSWT